MTPQGATTRDHAVTFDARFGSAHDFSTGFSA
jgi:hypothetical protein